MIPFEDAIVEILEEMTDKQREVASVSGTTHELRRHLFYTEVLDRVKKHASAYKQELAKARKDREVRTSVKLGLGPQDERERCYAVAELIDHSGSWELMHRCPDGDKPCCKWLGAGRHLMIFAKS